MEKNNLNFINKRQKTFIEKNNVDINSIEKEKHEDDININNEQEENSINYYTAKRSYSCRINEPKNKNFVNKEEIKLNLNNKFMYLKTPQIKPKKASLNPAPINLGSISCIKKKTRFNLLNNDNNIIKDIISEGENEESNEFSIDSSSDFTGGEEIKITQENSEFDIIDNNENDFKENDLACKKLKSENTKYEKDEDYKIEEENDDFDENGKISLKNVRKYMIQTKKKISKNINDIFYKIDNNYNEQYKKYKEEILMGEEEEEEVGRYLHKTTGFSQAHQRSGLPILEFLKKNSSTGINLKNN